VLELLCYAYPRVLELKRKACHASRAYVFYGTATPPVVNGDRALLLLQASRTYACSPRHPRRRRRANNQPHPTPTVDPRVSNLYSLASADFQRDRIAPITPC
jgi:hypothetical protein